MEREVMLTGIGGQSVQLAAQVLARAAVEQGCHVTYLGTYGGTMRGGNTDSTVIVGNAPIVSPPIVETTWSALVMHHQFWEPLRVKLRPGSVVVVNSSLFQGELDRAAQRVFDIPATELATEMGNSLSASLVLLGAYASLTQMLGLPALLTAMRASVPAYRQQHVESNERALAAGFELAPPAAAPAWSDA
jgi:Pyruvate/2-oxoacid:ferredoxin oxidoreductase gamma subunit